MEYASASDREWLSQLPIQLFDGINASDITSFKMKVPFVLVKNGKGYKVSFYNTADVCFRLSGITVENSFKDLEAQINTISNTLNNFLTGDPNNNDIIDRLSEVINLIYQTEQNQQPTLIGLQNQINELKDSVVGVTNRLGTAETNITNLINARTQQDNKITAIQNNVNLLQPQINTNATNISTLNTKLAALEAKFDAVNFDNLVTTNTNQTITGTKTFSTLNADSIHSGGIELDRVSSSAGNGGYIDFHYNGSTSDYTSRIIECSRGQLCFANSSGTYSFLGIQEMDATSSGTKYVLFTNKLLIQWGSGTTTGGGLTVSFSKPYYSVANYSVAFSFSINDQTQTGLISVAKNGNAGLKFSGSASGSYSWMTVGLLK